MHCEIHGPQVGFYNNYVQNELPYKMSEDIEQAFFNTSNIGRKRKSLFDMKNELTILRNKQSEALYIPFLKAALVVNGIALTVLSAISLVDVSMYFLGYSFRAFSFLPQKWTKFLKISIPCLGIAFKYLYQRYKNKVETANSKAFKIWYEDHMLEFDLLKIWNSQKDAIRSNLEAWKKECATLNNLVQPDQQTKLIEYGECLDTASANIDQQSKIFETFLLKNKEGIAFQNALKL